MSIKLNLEDAPLAIATAKHVSVSPRKARRVLNLLRGKSVVAARSILRFLPQAISEQILKVLNSAAANAENNQQLNPSTLVVSEAYATEGPTLKRTRPGSHGRAFRIRKRTSHITIILASISREKRAAGKKTAAKPSTTSTRATASSKSSTTAKSATSKTSAKNPTTQKVAGEKTSAKSTAATKTTSAKAKQAAKSTTKSAAAKTDRRAKSTDTAKSATKKSDSKDAPKSDTGKEA